MQECAVHMLAEARKFQFLPSNIYVKKYKFAITLFFFKLSYFSIDKTRVIYTKKGLNS
jgi:hypothetical protein